MDSVLGSQHSIGGVESERSRSNESGVVKFEGLRSNRDSRSSTEEGILDINDSRSSQTGSVGKVENEELLEAQGDRGVHDQSGLEIESVSGEVSHFAEGEGLGIAVLGGDGGGSSVEDHAVVPGGTGAEDHGVSVDLGVSCLVDGGGAQNENVSSEHEVSLGDETSDLSELGGGAGKSEGLAGEAIVVIEIIDG